MEDQLPQNETAESWAEQFARKLDEQRQRARQWLGDQQQRFDGIEKKLLSQLDELARQLTAEYADVDSRQDQVDRQAAVLAEQAGALERLKDELVQREDRWNQFHAQLQAQHDHLAQDARQQREALDERLILLAGERREYERQQRQLEEMTARLTQESTQLQQRQAQVAARDEETQHRQGELARQLTQAQEHSARLAEREAALVRQTESLDQLQTALEEARRRFEEEVADLAGRRSTLEQEAARLAGWESRLKDREAQTQSLRRSIARELKARRAELLAELEQLRQAPPPAAAGDDGELARQLTAAMAERDRLKAELQSAGPRQQAAQGQLDTLLRERATRQSELERLTGELDERKNQLQQKTQEMDRAAAEAERLRGQLAELEQEAASQQTAAQVALSQARGDQEQLHEQLTETRRHLTQRTEELNQLKAKLAEQPAGAGDAGSVEQELLDELERLRSDRDELLVMLEAQKSKPQASSINEQQVEDLRRRFEMAVQDVRELKTKNSELEEQLTKARRASGGGGGAAVPGQKLDWEAQKRALMAQLESDFDEENPQEADDKLTVEGTIRITDEVVSEKDREIQALKEQLEGRGAAKGQQQVASGANAVAQILDQDDLIRQERENLRRLQEEWREKLSKAEIDLSVERAKMARERTEMDEKLRALDAERSQQPGQEAGGGSDASKKPTRGRWLARLGLKDNDES